MKRLVLILRKVAKFVFRLVSRLVALHSRKGCPRDSVAKQRLDREKKTQSPFTPPSFFEHFLIAKVLQNIIDQNPAEGEDFSHKYFR